jgi:hypothetical protein
MNRGFALASFSISPPNVRPEIERCGLPVEISVRTDLRTLQCPLRGLLRRHLDHHARFLQGVIANRLLGRPRTASGQPHSHGRSRFVMASLAPQSEALAPQEPEAPRLEPARAG